MIIKDGQVVEEIVGAVPFGQLAKSVEEVLEAAQRAQPARPREHDR